MKTKIIQTEPPIPVEIMAQAIKEITDAMRAIDRSRLQRRTIVALIHDQSKLAEHVICFEPEVLAAFLAYIKSNYPQYLEK